MFTKANITPIMCQERTNSEVVSEPNPMAALSAQLADVRRLLKLDGGNDYLWRLKQELRQQCWEIQAESLRSKIETEIRPRKKSRLSITLGHLERHLKDDQGFRGENLKVLTTLSLL